MDIRTEQPLLLSVLEGDKTARPPVWFMRQAGRTLPEYRALREKAPDFISFCLNPEMAAEATLQPMRRFALDAAVVFADILLLPRVMGQDVWFEAGEGPRLGEMPSLEALQGAAPTAGERLSQVGETLALVRAELEPHRALIGFAGAPWTVATYMIEGRGSDRERARSLAYEQPQFVDRLLQILADATVNYLAMQALAGAQALKLFESWAENLPEDLFQRLVVAPHRRIVEGLRALGIETPVIGFPRGAPGLVELYAASVPVQAVALDVGVSAEAGRRIQRSKAIQGALDPLLMRAGGPALDARVDQLIEQWGGGPYVFNLGHGLIPDTPIEHIARVVDRVVRG
jgi:uroporphyrinogen decarboxylase